LNKTVLFVLVFSIVWLCVPAAKGVAISNDSQIDLAKSIPLKLRYPIGETLFYRLERRSEFFRMKRPKSGEHKAIAYFIRKRIENSKDGLIQEKFTWMKFGFGESHTPTQPVRLSYLKEAEGFSLTCSVTDEDLITRFDFSSLPRTVLGMWFMIMSWDAVTFDGAVRPQKHYDFPERAPLGSVFTNTRGAYDFSFEYPPLVTNSKYTFSGKNHAKIIGVGIEKETPCAIIEFRHSENVITMNLDLKTATVSNRGLEHICGQSYVSLDDGRIVKGILTAPVAQIQDFSLAGQEKPQHLEYLVIQRLELDLMSPEEFKKQISKD
jgi:hypothetical protein